jgi:hypothetical protein
MLPTQLPFEYLQLVDRGGRIRRSRTRPHDSRLSTQCVRWDGYPAQGRTKRG